MREGNGNVFQSIVSILGLIVSFVTALTPLFNVSSPISVYFLNKNILQPVSFLVFVVGIAVAWYITQFNQNPSLQIFPYKDKTYSFITHYRLDFSTRGIITLTLLISILFGIIFIAIYYFNPYPDWGKVYGFIQGVIYILLFILWISLFSILYAQTRIQFYNQELVERFPLNVLETLNRHKIINSGIQISENKLMNTTELSKEGYNPQLDNGLRKVEIKTINQGETTLTAIVDFEGKQLLKILDKKRLKKNKK